MWEVLKGCSESGHSAVSTRARDYKSLRSSDIIQAPPMRNGFDQAMDIYDIRHSKNV